MKNHKIQRIIELCDKAITEKTLMRLWNFMQKMQAWW